MAAERGSATLWCVALSGLLFAIATTFAMVGAIRVAHHRAQSAADLSVLVAARWALAAPTEACERASRLAAENGAQLVRCILTDAVADLAVSVGLSLPVLGDRVVLARARAGPANGTPDAPSGPAP
ncbi:Rv3654c family TadE-like protein [Nonomuraea africana]|uniref:Secretion/DNA translocation related TadE-like protein n=1 Tax=Nonomuraea africana TaxID=46171 RepID=A0ABR9KS25_9ACTN|nr:Rv3654c family TadE-like protein [Nonomuraea africana]MBE1564832.1 secretion/DNA translocation related TadE-like protein [Nonomuraea africana]